MDLLTISPPRCVRDGLGSFISATIQTVGKRFDVWYRVSSGPVADGVETFVAGSLLPAMRLGHAVQAPGPVSPRLLDGLHGIQRILHGWYPHLQTVPILAPCRQAPQPRGRGVACFFSGGVDSFYSLLKHYDEITHAILILGFEAALNRPQARAAAVRAMRHAALELNRPLIEVDTNLRDFAGTYTAFDSESHGSILASIALLLAPQFHTVYIPSTYTSGTLFPWGSHPDVDPLWSTEEVEIVHDGCDQTRIQKMARIAQYEPALKALRVCFNPPDDDVRYNCGRCEKCLRTMVELRAVGALERCPTFREPLNLRNVALLDLRDRPAARFFAATHAELERTGKDAELAAALAECLSGCHYRGVEGMLRQAARSIRKKAYRRLARPIIESIRWLTKDQVFPRQKAG